MEANIDITSMKTLILAGGLGTRFREETMLKPKPMITIGDKPILGHIFDIFVQQGLLNFVIAKGYLGNQIDEWLSSFCDKKSTTSDFTEFFSKDGKISIITIDTGLNSQTGGRIKKVFEILPLKQMLVTYGDGLGNVDIRKLIKFHEKRKSVVTVTAVRPPARFGNLKINSFGRVKKFGEKVQSESGWINGGFFVIESKVTNYISSYENSFESDSLPLIAKRRELSAYKHEGFWHPMDTIREKELLEEYLAETPLPWLANL